MMTYVDESEEQKDGTTKRRIGDTSHNPIPIPKTSNMKAPTCMICSMEEGILRKVLKKGKIKARQYSRRKKHLAICSDPNCNVVCHSTHPAESNIRKIPAFAGLSCFEVAHHPDCDNLFVDICRRGNTYTRSVRKHPITKMIAEIYESQLPRKSERPRGRPRRSNVVTNQTQPIREIQTRGRQITSADAMSTVSNITTTPATKPAQTATTTRTRAKKRKQNDELVASRPLHSTRSRSTRKRQK